MKPPSESAEPDIPQKSLRARVADTLEHAFVTIAQWSIPLFIPVGCLFFVYLVGGYLAISLGVWSPSYEFLSLSENAYFVWLGFLCGIGICCGTGSLIGIAFLTNGEGHVHNDISILSSFIGFGFGAGMLRITVMPVLATLPSIL